LEVETKSGASRVRTWMATYPEPAEDLEAAGLSESDS